MAEGPEDFTILAAAGCALAGSAGAGASVGLASAALPCPPATDRAVPPVGAAMKAPLTDPAAPDALADADACADGVGEGVGCSVISPGGFTVRGFAFCGTG